MEKTTGRTFQRAQLPKRASHAPRWIELIGTAHPEYCKQGTGATYNIGLYMISYPYRLCLMKDDMDGTRTVVGTYGLTDQTIPYIHSFGMTPTKAIVVLQPLRENWNRNAFTKGFMPAMDHVETTKVIVWDIKTGRVVADTILSENIYF
jgi:carotenoid cleavage dioxygenase-like enzyme